jgi:hypothetical protein
MSRVNAQDACGIIEFRNQELNTDHTEEEVWDARGKGEEIRDRILSPIGEQEEKKEKCLMILQYPAELSSLCQEVFPPNLICGNIPVVDIIIDATSACYLPQSLYAFNALSHPCIYWFFS